MTEDTTTQQLAEIEGQPTDYTPPEGWRLLEVGETLQEGDVSVRADGHWCPTERVGSVVGTKQRYIRPIEQSQPQPQPEPQPQPQPLQVREGRWKTRGGKIVQVVPTDEARERDRNNGWLWMGAAASESDYWHADGTWLPARAPHDHDLVEYLGPIEPQPADTVDELRSEVSYVQNLLGESRQRVTHLEELVTSLQREVAVAKEELTIAAAVSHQLQIELDAAQQVPVDSLDLQQLRLRLADMTLDRDTCKDAYDRIFADLVTIRETTAADTVEAIIEWLEPFRGCNSPSLALLLLEALPHIMRSLTGLADEEIE